MRISNEKSRKRKSTKEEKTCERPPCNGSKHCDPLIGETQQTVKMSFSIGEINC